MTISAKQPGDSGYRHSKHVGKIFHRLIEQMVVRKAESYNEIIGIL